MKAIEARIPFGLGRYVTQILIVLVVAYLMVTLGTVVWSGAIQPFAGLVATISLPSLPTISLTQEQKKLISLLLSVSAFTIAALVVRRQIYGLRRQFMELRRRFREEALVNEGLRAVAILSLAILRDNAVSFLRNRKISSEEELKQLASDVRQWELSVEEILDKANIPMAIPAFRLADVDAITPDGWNHEHCRLRFMIEERIDRLSGIIKGLEESEKKEG